MEIGAKFVDLSSYNENMAKGIEDKLFFLKHLEKDKEYIFVDFGCADGSLISAMYELFNKEGCTKNKYVGYDISETMIDFAKTKFNFPTNDVTFTTDWDTVEEKLVQYNGKKKVLVLSSVIHEVFSYASEIKDILDFWGRVTHSDFDYVCIRDMMPSSDIDRPTNIWVVTGFYENHGEMYQLKDFEEKWGKITNNLNFVHFLLKYRWEINWNRELNENYFPMYVDDLPKNMEGYKLDYLERFRVPFLEECWEKDFGVKIDDYTHVKAIFSKAKKL